MSKQILAIAERLRQAPVKVRAQVAKHDFATQVGLLEACIASAATELESLISTERHCLTCEHHPEDGSGCNTDVFGWIYVFEDHIPCAKWKRRNT